MASTTEEVAAGEGNLLDLPCAQPWPAGQVQAARGQVD